MAPTAKTVAKKSAPKKSVKKPVKKVAKAAIEKKSKPSVKTAPSLKTAPAAKVGYGIAVGVAAPDFKLQDDGGSTVTLKGLRGKTVVLYFYPKDMTGGCTQESCDFRDNLNRLTGKGAVVLGVSADTVESHKRFKAKYAFNFPLLADPDKVALGAYGVWQEKSLYGRKFMGIVRTTYIIDGQGKVAKVFPKVKVAGHVDEVLAAL